MQEMLYDGLTQLLSLLPQMMSLQDDDQDDNSADRLVIDEGIHNNNPVGGGGNLLGNTHGVVHGNYSAFY